MQSSSEPVHEQISAFLDGELPQREIDLLLRRMEREDGLRNMAARYTAIGESLRGNSAVAVSWNFASRVTQAVASEGVVADGHGLSRAGWLRSAGRLAGGVAIAATVAAAAIIGLQRQSVAPPTVIAQSQPAPAPAVLASADIPSATVVLGDRRGSGEPVSYVVPSSAITTPLVPAARLTDYVIAHSEYSSPLGRRNVLSGVIGDDSVSGDGSGSGDQ